MTSHEWEVLYLVGLMGFAIAVPVTTIIDIARRPPGQRILDAWGKTSTFRDVALVGFGGLVLLGMLLGLWE